MLSAKIETRETEAKAVEQRQRDDDARSADRRGQPAADHRAEDEQQRQQREGEGEQLGAAQVALGHGLHIGVEDRRAADDHRQIRRLCQPGA